MNELRAAVDAEIQAMQQFFTAHADIVETKTAVLILSRKYGLDDHEIGLLAQGKGNLVVKEE